MFPTRSNLYWRCQFLAYSLSFLSVRCWLRSVSRIVYHFLTLVARDIRKLYHIFPCDCLADACIITIDKRCTLVSVYDWCCVAVFFVTAQYVIGGGWGFGVIFCTHYGTVLRVIPYPWVLFRIGLHEEAHFLKPLGDIFIITDCVCLVGVQLCCGCASFYLRHWDGWFKNCIVFFGGFVLPFS